MASRKVDVRDEDDLLESIVQPMQQADDILAARFVERAKHLVENEQRQRLTRSLGDHLRDREAQDEVCEIVFAAGDNVLRQPVFDEDKVVILVQLKLRVSAVGELCEQNARAPRN